MPEITFELIKAANESIQTTDIKGKAYADVAQRIKAFRMVYPDGCIRTEMVSDKDGVCIFRAEVSYWQEYEDESALGRTYKCRRQVPLGTGTAFERQGASFINKTSYIENCETSAVGRALGMAGFGIDVSVASADEVANAIAQQESGKDLLDKDAKTDLQAFTALKKRLMSAAGMSEKDAGKALIKLTGNPLELEPEKRKQALVIAESYVNGWEERNGESE